MPSLKENMQLFQQELEKGHIQDAYQGLIAFFGKLKNEFNNLPYEFRRTGDIYYGYLTMTFLSLFPASLDDRKLKVLVVFDYETFAFEVWLSGANRKVGAAHWRMIKDASWDRYALATDPNQEDYIVRSMLATDPDFGDLEELTEQITTGTISFIKNVEELLSQFPANS